MEDNQKQISDGAHERLCAYLFEELDAQTRAAFEAELAEDPALQAERAKIEASMNLVREFAPAAPDVLSNANREALTAAAAGSGASAPIAKLAWYRRPGLQMATAAGVAAMVIVATNEGAIVGTLTSDMAPETEVARLDVHENEEGEMVPGREVIFKPSSSGEHDGRFAKKEKLAPGGLGYLASKGPSAPGMQSLGYSSNQGEAASDLGGPGSAGQEVRFVNAPSVRETGTEVLRESTGASDWFLGLPTGAEATETQLKAHLGAATGSDRFRGPSDSAPTKESSSPGAGGLTTSENATVSLLTATSTPSAPGRTRGLLPGQGVGGGGDSSAVPPSAGYYDAVDQGGGAKGTTANRFDRSLGAPADLEDPAGLEIEETAEALRLRVERAKVGYLADRSDSAELIRLSRLERYKQLVQRARLLPNEKPSAMYFRYWGDNGFEFPATDRLSTFSADADTASYTLARKTIKSGYLPQRAQIRTEEFVNYFTPDVAPPTGDDVFNISHELAPSIFGPSPKDAVAAAAKTTDAYAALVEGDTNRWLLRVGVRGKVIPIEERAPLALTFVIDVSGSMEQDNRIGLVKHALRLLSAELDERDSVSIISFSKTAKRVLQMQSAGNAANFERALYDLETGGGTNVQSGLRMGYEEAVLGHVEGAVNRVVFLSDGVGNIAETDQAALLAETKRAREKGIYLNTIGVGMGNHNDTFLEQLANGGDGICNYVDDADEAERALVRNFTGAFLPIARDVKIQVDFNPYYVSAYRLLGYENRAIADVDFRNDKVDAGELGSGHQVVALYELVLNLPVTETREGALATTRVRYKLPYLEAESVDMGDMDPRASALEISGRAMMSKHAVGNFDGTSIGFQKSALAAEFAEMLRLSSHARQDSVSLLRYKLDQLAKSTSDAEVLELAALVQLAQPQLEVALLDVDPVTRAADDLAHFGWRCGTSMMRTNDESEKDALRLGLEKALRDALEL